MGKSTISMAIFNSYVKLPEGTKKIDSSEDFPLYIITMKRMKYVPWFFHDHQFHLNHPITEFDDGKIYRKPLYLMVKPMVSCRFSLKPIHWQFHLNHPMFFWYPHWKTTPQLPAWHVPVHDGQIHHGVRSQKVQGRERSRLPSWCWYFQHHSWYIESIMNLL